MEEIWKDIQGYEGLYQVSNLGRVKSMEMMLFRGKGYYKKPIKIRKLTHGKNGYYSVVLMTKKRFYVHRLVAKAFLQNENNYPCINHIDGNKLNNVVTNLEWANYSQNSKHAIKNGLSKMPSTVGEKNSQSKLTNGQVYEIKYVLKGLNHLEISKIYNVKRSTIQAILSNRNWKHI
jgi:hypothetical protein